MERIKLTKSEKMALRAIAEGRADDELLRDCPWSIDALCRKGLAFAQWSEGHIPVEVRLTFKGRAYLESNPRLRNPVDWSVIFFWSISFACVVSVTNLILVLVKRFLLFPK